MSEVFIKELIAPCGMNCGICKAYLREKNRCNGCNFENKNIPITRLNCILRNCEKRENEFCYDCREFPCSRLKHMDKRYRTKYAMSVIENLEYIWDHGIRPFINRENKKYVSREGVYCVHDQKYYKPVI